MKPPKTTAAVFAVAMMAATTMASTPASAGHHHRSSTFRATGVLTDLRPTDADPTDGAHYRVFQRRDQHGTTTRLLVKNIEAERGTRFGTHVHEGPCVEGDGAAAGPHWNSTGGAEVNDEVEVWLDLRVTRKGRAKDKSHIEATIPEGEGLSIVIHALPTDPGGAAGERLACLPLFP